MATPPPLRDDEPFGRTPAAAFETANGLTGISRDYRMPDEFAGWSRAQVDRWMHARLNEATAGTDKSSEVVALWNQLIDQAVARNPELTTVPRRRGDLVAEYDVMAGIAAGYNPNDIAHYITHHTPIAQGATHAQQMNHLDRLEAIATRMESIGELLHARNGTYTKPTGGCQFSPATLDLIEQQARTPAPKSSPAPSSRMPRAPRPK